jgi:PAS domain S-box-containing protein
MALDPALVDELSRLRTRVRELEEQLVDETNLLPGGELAVEVKSSLLRAGHFYVVVYDRAGRIVFFNRTDHDHSDQEILGTSVFNFTDPVSHEAMQAAIDHVFATGERKEVEALGARGGRWLNRLAPVLVAGKVVAVSNFALDITSRVIAEQELRGREARLRFLVEHMPVILWTIDRELRFTSSSGRGLKHLGLQPGELDGRSFAEYFAGAKEGEFVVDAHRRALAGDSVTYEQEWAGRRYQVLIEPLRDETGSISGAFGVAIDITDRWTAARQMRLDRDELERRVAERTEQLAAANQSLLRERRVLQRLLDLHDRDRQLVSYEIHDGIVQEMTGALLYFDSSADAAAIQGGRAAEGHRHGVHALQNAIAEARRLINGLRPPVLDEFGLIDAIANHIEELRVKSEIEIEFEHDVEFVRLAPVVETAIYRIVQEALNNVWLHSGASRAAVSLMQHEDRIHITVQDWGAGFDMQAVTPKRFGLLSIRDRARLLGGDSSIVTAPGQGTRVEVTLPVVDVLLPGIVKDEREE